MVTTTKMNFDRFS